MSVVNGAVARSEPFTGKIVKGHLAALSADDGPLPFDELARPVTAAAISDDGSTVIWGLRTGEVRCTFIDRTSHITRTSSSRLIGRHTHRDRVSAISVSPWPKAATGIPASPSSFFVTASIREVKLWCLAWSIEPSAARSAQRFATGHCLWTAALDLDELDDRIANVTFMPPDNSESAYVAAATERGEVHCWRVNVQTVDQITSAFLAGYELVKSSATFSPIDTLWFDPDPLTPSLLVHHHEEPFFERRFPFSTRTLVVYGNAKMTASAITCLAVDFGTIAAKRSIIVDPNLDDHRAITSDGQHDPSDHLWHPQICRWRRCSGQNLYLALGRQGCDDSQPAATTSGSRIQSYGNCR